MNLRDTPADRAVWDRIERSFRPKHCPYFECPSNTDGDFVCDRHGWHKRRYAPRLAQRFRCRRCKRTFSTQTFRYSYWQKRPDIDRCVQNSGRACSGNRQMATMFGCSPSTIAAKVTRLARHAIRFHVKTLSAVASLAGTVLFDGLGSFEHSQYSPYWLNAAIHAETALVLGFTESALRRSGTMTKRQQEKRAELERKRGTPPRDTVRTETAELLRAVKPFFDWTKTKLRSDKHKAYRAAVKDAGLGEVEHETVDGSAPRGSPDHPLWEINLADLLIRHDSSNQKRETIAFNKRRQSGLEKAWIWATWRNYMRRRFVKRPSPTPAMLAELAEKPLAFEDIFDERIFDWKVPVAPAWAKQIARDIVTLDLEVNRRHRLVFAY